MYIINEKEFRYNRDKNYYNVHFKIGIAISIVICIVLLKYFPEIKKENETVPYFTEPVLTLSDIPKTQFSTQSAPPKPAMPNLSSLIVLIDNLELLPDVIVKEFPSNKDIAENTDNLQGSPVKSIYEASTFPFLPRQILEVVPQNIEDVEGNVTVKLLVGKDGFVKEYNIISNSTNSEKIIKYIGDAVLKSRWQPITIEEQQVEYWIEKTYTFN